MNLLIVIIYGCCFFQRVITDYTAVNLCPKGVELKSQISSRLFVDGTTRVNFVSICNLYQASSPQRLTCYALTPVNAPVQDLSSLFTSREGDTPRSFLDRHLWFGAPPAAGMQRPKRRNPEPNTVWTAEPVTPQARLCHQQPQQRPWGRGGTDSTFPLGPEDE